MGGYSNNGQTSLNNNRSLREKNRWKFDGAEYPMPESFNNPDANIDKERLKIAENNKNFRLIIEYAVILGIFIGVLYYVFLILY